MDSVVRRYLQFTGRCQTSTGDDDFRIFGYVTSASEQGWLEHHAYPIEASGGHLSTELSTAYGRDLPSYCLTQISPANHANGLVRYVP